jgi:monofunctional glycosyltransferase
MRWQNIQKWNFRKAMKLLMTIFVYIILSQIIAVIALRWIPVYVTPLMIIREIEKTGTEKPFGFTKKWKSLDQISDHLKVAVVCAEDQRFFDHWGFDLKAIEKAIDYNAKQQKRGKKKQRGASTISQQTAKNVFLWPKRSWLRKGLEVWFTLLIEVFWSKERILEVYLNVIETGDSVYGVEAAAQKYWNKPAAKLSAEKSALVAAVLPSPLRYSAKKPGPYIQNRQQWILKQMRYNAPLYKKVVSE